MGEALEHDELSARAAALAPWRYDHEGNGIVIRGEALSARVHGEWGKGREVMEQVVAGVVGGRDASTLRALDLGCLEGHYTDVLCAAGFGEVVGFELSKQHVRRAEFLLGEVKQHRNFRIVEGNVEDRAVLRGLGKFDLVLFHGLLYHLVNPFAVLDSLNALVRDAEVFTLLLSTQFKFSFAEIASPWPMANIKIRKIAADAGGLVTGADDSSFASVAMRLNALGVHRLLEAAGFTQLVGYDTPLGSSLGYHAHVIARKQPDAALVDRLESGNAVPGLRFYAFDGTRIDGADLDTTTLRLLRWLYVGITERLGGSFRRQSARAGAMDRSAQSRG